MKNRQTDAGIRIKPPQITLSADGYVRLTLDTLLTIRFSHSISGMYEDMLISAGEGASLSATYGYTEWVSTTKPLLSLGWDWQLGGGGGTSHPSVLVLAGRLPLQQYHDYRRTIARSGSPQNRSLA